MAVEGAPAITPADVAAAAAAVRGLAKLGKNLFGGRDKSPFKDEGFKARVRDIFKDVIPKKPTPAPVPTAQLPPRPPQITQPGPPKVAPSIEISEAKVTPAPSRIPDQVGDIFKGTTRGKAAKIGKDIAKGVGKGARGSVVGTAAILAIEAGQAIINARDAQKALEDRQYREKTKREEARDNARVREIRERQRLEDQRIAREEKERDRQAAMARTQARIAARKAEVEARATERQLAREANNRAKAKLEENKQLEAEEKKLQQQQAKQAKAARTAQMQRIRNLASVAGLLYSLSKGSKKGRNFRPPETSPLVPNPPGATPDRPRRTLPGRPPVVQRPAVNDFGISEPPTMLSSSLAATKTRTTTRTKVAKCKSDTPKRKKGRCRTGFFRETPNRTTYKTWSERKCL